MGLVYAIFQLAASDAFQIVPGSCVNSGSYTTSYSTAGYNCSSYLNYTQLGAIFQTEVGLTSFLEKFPEINKVEILGSNDTSELDASGRLKAPELKKRAVYVLIEFDNSSLLKKALFLAEEEFKICAQAERPSSCSGERYMMRIKGPVKIYGSNTPEDIQMAAFLNSNFDFSIESYRPTTSYNSSSGSYTQPTGQSTFRVGFTVSNESSRLGITNRLIKKGVIAEFPSAEAFGNAFGLSAKIAMGVEGEGR